jgi:hypothetical protein
LLKSKPAISASLSRSAFMTDVAFQYIYEHICRFGTKGSYQVRSIFHYNITGP